MPNDDKQETRLAVDSAEVVERRVTERRASLVPEGHEGGVKEVAGKLRYDLLDPFAIAWLVASLTYGAEKYAPENWRKVTTWREDYVASLRRHLDAWVMGEEYDPESGLPHLAGVMFAAMCLTALSAPRKLDTVRALTDEAAKRWKRFRTQAKP